MLLVLALRQLTARIGVEDRGATAVEYGLMVALIAVAIITAVVALGGEVRTTFENIVTCLQDSTAAVCN